MWVAVAAALASATLVIVLLQLRPVSSRGRKPAPAHVYFLRHAETVANSTGVWNEQTASAFSATGLDQVKEATQWLTRYRFDAIVVSPMWRTQNTVLPFLKANGLSAEIWPELAECCWQKDRSAPVSTPMPMFGRPIIPEDSSRLHVREERATLEWNETTYGDGMRRVRAAVDLLRERFAGTGKSVLVVGHGNAGQRLIQLLRGREPEEGPPLANARLTHLAEQADGRFELAGLNGQ